ncbi:hypothetical protein PACILC2_30870 [Paenibacillus cisolokensis]|uniref:SMP-30/Gluconolactonase/LRE-like region domain-containing protein n=1 Tax=Paenibacillus cisolokensis TaxID=1658519 RepID=A0ABQ4N976_9BACL|nr:NHL repeat-containing protein [Paenibacillus cisolokensis]GIQ64519.1 hypothetical protein PACILC2_30870 [Paenibacillus cisolokensis]
MSNKLRHARIRLLAVLSMLLSVGAGGTLAYADGGSESYNYSFWGDTVPAPAAYEATVSIAGEGAGAGPFKDPSDLHVTPDGRIYVLDSGNNRIVVLNRQFKEVETIDAFDNGGSEDAFLNPQGLFVTEQGQILVADTGNKRVVHLDQNRKLVKIVDSPESELLQADFDFQPVRVVVDKAQRLYVMAVGVFDGFMEFNANGEFTTFIGANRVRVDPVELFWKRFSTRAQRSRMVMFTPTEFTNMDINEEGFIYATNGDAWGDTIKKLNAQGNDILRRTGYFSPRGEVRYTNEEGPSRLVDIDVADSEIYSVLDAKRGRIYTYNGDGHFMYVFGGLGNRLGEFNTPVAIERVRDDFLVLDKALGEITVFRTTEYGRTLNEAVRAYYRGDEEKAFELFQKTINMNANLEFAYAGIGKALLRQGDYAEAMKYFKRSMDQANYSKAFLLYRKEVLREYFPSIMTGIVVLLVVAFAWRKYRKAKGGKRNVSVEQRVV